MDLTTSQTYDKSVIPRLVSTLGEFFYLNPALEALISATIRNEETFETFLNACSGSLHVLFSWPCYDIGRVVADFCGVGRNRFSFEQVDCPPVPEHQQKGPFYPTSTPIQLWRVTRGRYMDDAFSV